MKLSLLIPTITKRKLLLQDLLFVFDNQINQNFTSNNETEIDIITYNDIEILFFMIYSLQIGTKRNRLLEVSKGEYVCFFDDDDLPSKDYISTLLEAIETKPDCVSLRGIMTTNGSNPEIFEHSLKYKAWKTTKNKIKYERYPNHLNCIRADIAKQFKFPEVNHGEDYNWSKQLHESGLLKNEYYTEKVLYYYKFVTNK